MLAILGLRSTNFGTLKVGWNMNSANYSGLIAAPEETHLSVTQG